MIKNPKDSAGAETLDIMRAAPRYNYWQYRTISQHLGRRVLEVGSGIGNMSAHILSDARDLVILTDTDEWYCDLLRTQFGDRARIEYLTLPDASAGKRFAKDRLDTVVALNVVEHIENDLETVKTMRDMVVQNGRIIVLVPALQTLFGSLDRELGHYRRYSRRSLYTLFERAKLQVEHLEWFNLVGAIGWWFNARVRRVPRVPIKQLQMFDAIVPLVSLESHIPLPFGQSLIAIGKRV